MKRPVGTKPACEIVWDPLETVCPACGRTLHVSQHRGRWVERFDGYFHIVRRDRKCRNPECPGPKTIYRPPEDLRFALPRCSYGLDITLAVGERHLRGESLLAIKRDLNARGFALDQRHTGRIFRDFLALCEVARGDEAQVREALCAHGGIVLMCDGVQFDAHAPVLYLAWDAMSGTPLFGEHKAFRGEDDLRLILERVKAMDVPLIAIVSDKEKGLVPAVQAVFPEVPYQFCQTHFLKNAAKPLASDLRALGGSVVRRATRVQRIAKEIHDAERAVAATAATTTPEDEQKKNESCLPKPTLSDIDLAKRVCELVRENARVSGKPLTDPPELKRHQRLEALREVVEDARKKGETSPIRAVAPGSTPSLAPSL